MKNKKLIFSVSLILSLTSCRGDEEYNINGQKFCVPEPYTISDVPWVPTTPNIVNDDSLLFSVCSYKEANEKPQCLRKNNIENVLLYQVDTGRGVTKEGTPQEGVSEGVGGPLENNDEGEMYSLFQEGRGNYHIFLDDMGFFDYVLDKDHNKKITKGDFLVASCKKWNKDDNDFFCDRWFLTSYGEISYSFTLKTINPEMITAVHEADREVVKTLEKLKCQ